MSTPFKIRLGVSGQIQILSLLRDSIKRSDKEPFYVSGIFLFSITPSVIPIAGRALSRLRNGLTKTVLGPSFQVTKRDLFPGRILERVLRQRPLLCRGTMSSRDFRWGSHQLEPFRASISGQGAESADRASWR